MKNISIALLQCIGFLIHKLHMQNFYNRFCSLRNHIYTGLYQLSFSKFGRSIIQYPVYSLRGEENISIGDDCVFERDLQLEAWGTHAKIVIGNGCLFRRNCHITATKSIIIGDGFLTGDNVLISDNSHGDSTIESLSAPPRERPIVSKGGIVIGKNVWLGNNVCVLSNVNIGDGVVVGANSVVTHDIPPYCIAAGSPAKIIKRIK